MPEQGGYSTGLLESCPEERTLGWVKMSAPDRPSVCWQATRLRRRIAYFAPGDQMPLLTWFPFDISAIQVFPSAGLLGLASNYRLGQFKGNSPASHSFLLFSQKTLEIGTGYRWPYLGAAEGTFNLMLPFSPPFCLHRTPGIQIESQRSSVESRTHSWSTQCLSLENPFQG